jgi:hypothetical protein
MQATQAVSPQAGITAPSGDISTLTHYPCESASVIRVGAVCSTAGATLTCRIIFLDAVGDFAAVSSPVTFTADTTSLDGTQYLATPNPDAWFPIGGPSIFAIHVDAVSAGTWALTPMAC